MKILILSLLVSVSALSQGKARYQIVECKPIDGFALVILLDTETGKAWNLVADSVETTYPTAEMPFAKKRYYKWRPILFNQLYDIDRLDDKFYYSPQEVPKKK